MFMSRDVFAQVESLRNLTTLSVKHSLALKMNWTYWLFKLRNGKYMSTKTVGWLNERLHAQWKMIPFYYVTCAAFCHITLPPTLINILMFLHVKFDRNPYFEHVRSFCWKLLFNWHWLNNFIKSHIYFICQCHPYRSKCKLLTGTVKGLTPSLLTQLLYPPMHTMKV